MLLKKEKMFIGVTRHENEDKTNFDESNENFKKLKNTTRIFVYIPELMYFFIQTTLNCLCGFATVAYN